MIIAGILNALWYVFVLWLCGFCPPLGIILLIISLIGDLKED